MKPKQYYYVILGLMTILVVGAGGGYYWVTTKISSDTEALKRQLAEVEVADITLEELGSLKRQYQRIEPTLAKLDMALPRDKKQSEIIMQLQQIAAAAGMIIPTASFNSTAGAPSVTSQTVKEGDALVMPLMFQSTGSYEQLQSFLVGVEKLNRYTSITNLGITKSDKPKSLRFTINMNIYLKP